MVICAHLDLGPQAKEQSWARLSREEQVIEECLKQLEVARATSPKEMRLKSILGEGADSRSPLSQRRWDQLLQGSPILSKDFNDAGLNFDLARTTGAGMSSWLVQNGRTTGSEKHKSG